MNRLFVPTELKKMIVATVVFATAILLLSGFAQPAKAGVGLGISPSFPSSLTVGDTGVAVSLAITNNSDGGDGDPVDLTLVTLIPSCGANSGSNCTSPDPGVFDVSASGSGANSCSGINFTIGEIDAPTGKVEFTPDSTVTLGLGETCLINFTVDVLKVPGVDASGSAGLQTRQVGYTEAVDQNDSDLTGIGAGTDTTTVNPADSDAVTHVHDDEHDDVTNTSIPAGTEIHDFVVVSGVGDITPTGDVDFVLYDNLTCDGQELDSENVNLDGDGEAESTPFTPDAGEYSYLVTYNGDANYNSDEAACEPFTIVEPLVIEKTATTSYDREWTWTIEKVGLDDLDGDPILDPIELAEGETYTVYYEVEVDASSEDINMVVSGTVTVTNPDGNPAVDITDIEDELDSTGVIDLDCEDEDGDTSAPWTLDGGEVLSCTYSEEVDDMDDGENMVTVTTDGTVPGGEAFADVDWGDPENEIDECVEVGDSVAGLLDSELCAGDAPETYTYDWTFGPDDGIDIDTIVACDDDILWPNTATATTTDTNTVVDDEWEVNVVVDCFQGCTLTQGYWKTHSGTGPAPYDDNWQNIFGTIYDDGDGDNEEEGEEFYKSLQTWYEVFWTPPSGGNAYYKLAHQYMAAVLNTLNGASAPSDVEDAIADSHDLFTAFAPDELVGYAKTNKKGVGVGKKTILQPEAWDDMNEYASLLASYNEGDIGPGHCDEQVPEGTI